MGLKLVRIGAGEARVAASTEVLEAKVLEQVAVCFSVAGKAGGLAIAPDPGAVELVVEKFLTPFRGNQDRAPGSITAKLIGGAGEQGQAVLAAVRRHLRNLSIEITAEACGGDQARSVLYYGSSQKLRWAGDSAAPAATAPAPKRTLIRVLIIDDSRTIRAMLKGQLEQDPELSVIGSAGNGRDGERLIEELRPDVVTLDVHMPHGNGMELLARVMPARPVPVVMISAQGQDDGPEVLQCLELGAVDYLQKPIAWAGAREEFGESLREKVRAAASARIRPVKRYVARPRLVAAKQDRGSGAAAAGLLAIGASTGGTEAVKELLLALPGEPPPTVIVQHIPPFFSKAFAQRLNELCPFVVKEAEDGDLIEAGRVLIAPGGMHMRVQPERRGWRIAITDDAPINRHKPSVDALFHSVATSARGHAMGVVLTGMGADGAAGLLAMQRAGCRVAVQDEASSVVYGMPKEAQRLVPDAQSGDPQAIVRMITDWYEGLAHRQEVAS